MPEFQRQKRRSLTDQQLYEEYHRTDEPKKKIKPAPSAKKPAAKREAPPVSPQRLQKQEQRHEEPKKEERHVKTGSTPQKNAASAQKKPPAASSRRRRRGKMTLYYVLTGIVAVAALSILSVTVLFNISSFAVTGDTVYSEEEIITACGIEKGNNLLRIDIGKAEESIVSKLVYIDSARISRGFPNRLVITVEPAHPVLSFARGSSYYIISERGRLLEIGQISADCPVVKGFSPSVDSVIGAQLQDDEESRVAIALSMTEYMEQYGLNGYCEIDLSDTLNIRLIYDGRIEMEFGAGTRLEDKFYRAGLLLESEITSTEKCTLILSNPDRVVKRPIYDSDTDDEGYVVTTSGEEEPGEGEDGAGEGEPDNSTDDGVAEEP